MVHAPFRKLQWSLLGLTVAVLGMLLLPELPASFARARWTDLNGAETGGTGARVGGIDESGRQGAAGSIHSQAPLNAQAPGTLPSAATDHTSRASLSEKEPRRQPRMASESTQFASRATDGTLEALPIRYGADRQAGEGATEPSSNTTGGGMSALVQRGGDFAREVADHLFRVTVANVRGLRRLEQGELLRMAGLNDRPWIWLQGAAKIEQRLNAVSWVERSRVELSPFPARADIFVVEAEPWIVAEYERHSWIVSRRGKLLQPLDAIHNADVILESTEMPRLDGLDEDAANQSALSSANARFNTAVRTIDWLETTGALPFRVAHYHLLSNGAMVVQHAGAEGAFPQVIVRLESLVEARSAMNRLNSVLQDARARGEHLHRVDLRFRGQAIVD